MKLSIAGILYGCTDSRVLVASINIFLQRYGFKVCPKAARKKYFMKLTHFVMKTDHLSKVHRSSPHQVEEDSAACLDLHV